MADDYDIGAAFDAIEEELIASMLRNMDRHRAEEDKEGYLWSQWQVEQIRYLEQYKQQNRKKYPGKFRDINKKIEEMIRQAKKTGQMDQELSILEMIRWGFPAHKVADGMSGEFFRLNERKLEALIDATMNDMKKAETAVLRKANDQYRKAIYSAQMYANTGAGTYEKAVDMATKDMLAAGLTCVEYANGSRHTLRDYAEMAVQTASKRAYLQGEGGVRQEWGITTVIMNKRGNPCPRCLPFCGKVLIDDVWSGGSRDGKSPVTGLKYPLMSQAIAKGLYHPRCKDVHTTYFEGISTPPAGSPYSRDELDQIAEDYRQEQKRQYAVREAEKYGRLAKYSLDEENRKKYGTRAKQWKAVAKPSSSDIMKNIELPPETAQIESMSKDTREDIRKAFDDIAAQYQVKNFSLVTKSLGLGMEKVPFQYAPQNVGGYINHQIVINKDYYFNGSKEEFSARIMRNYNNGVLAAKSVEDLISHELAHLMTFQHCETYGEFRRVEGEVRACFIRGVSGYADASYDGAETIAEAFVRQRNGEEVSEAVARLLEKYIERWKK